MVLGLAFVGTVTLLPALKAVLGSYFASTAPSDTEGVCGAASGMDFIISHQNESDFHS